MELTMVEYISQMYDKTFNAQQLRRKVRKHYKVYITGNTLGIASRLNNSAVKIEVEPHEFEDTTTVCTVVWSRAFGESRTFQFHISSNRELLQKLVKHNLLI